MREASDTQLPLGAHNNIELSEEDRKVRSEVEEKYTTWRMDRNPHDIQWFISAAAVRGLTDVYWNDVVQQLERQESPPHRVRLSVNRILPKYKARQAKFLQQQFEPEVIPASGDRDDVLNARMTQLVLSYLLQKDGSERKYRQALNWANTCGKGFWWFYWDPAKKGTIQLDTPIGPQIQELQLGDVCIEVGSPFEILVADLGIANIGDQPEIMRVKLRFPEDLVKRYGDRAKGIVPDAATGDAFQYQRQIAVLSSKGHTGLTFADAGLSEQRQTKSLVMVKELFTRPCGKHRNGRHVIVAGGRVLLNEPSLPYNFGDMSNPYPVVEFPDTEQAGQFWPTTIVEQLIPIQREYNLVRSKIAENIKLHAHPKLIVPAYCKMPKNAYTSEPGEKIPIVIPPGANGPYELKPANITADAWRVITEIRTEFDEVSNIYPVSAGQNQGATSGFQVNLLQEAADSVHAPDIRAHATAFEEACYKMRRMLKQGYQLPRLVSVAGRNRTAEAFEFSRANIDEHAQIRVFTGSGLSNTPAIRTKQLMELQAQGILGPVDNPQTNRLVLKGIGLRGVPEIQEAMRQDEDLAGVEAERIRGGAQFLETLPMPWENHEVHWEQHTSVMKSAAFEDWDQVAQRVFIMHTVAHGFFIDPINAYKMALQLGLQEMLPWLDQQLAIQQAPIGQPQAPPAPQAPATPPQEVPATPPPAAQSPQPPPAAPPQVVEPQASPAPPPPEPAVPAAVA